MQINHPTNPRIRRKLHQTSPPQSRPSAAQIRNTPTRARRPPDRIRRSPGPPPPTRLARHRIQLALDALDAREARDRGLHVHAVVREQPRAELAAAHQAAADAGKAEAANA